MFERTVLVVEDEPLIRMTLAEALEEEGYRVLEAGNVLEAVAAIARSDRIDAVITDVDMPGALDGFDLMKIVAAQSRHMAAIITSGGHSADERELAPGCRFLAKPYRIADVLAELALQLESRQPEPVALVG